MKRRPFRTLLFILSCLLFYAVLVEPAMLGVTEHQIPMEGLPKALDGMRIVQVSDLHSNVWMRPGRIGKIVARVNSLHPDVILLTGDFVSRSESYCEPAAEALGGLKAKHGVYAVLGNHDYWTNAELMTQSLREQGIDVLFDEQREITIGKQRITLVGTDDSWEGDPDYESAYEGISHEDTCIAMAHNPDAVLSMEGKPADLLITGHTHGGIINLPIVGPLLSVSKLGPKYASGMFTINGIRTYVCRGIGTGVGSHIRFRTRPEIPVFVLRQAG